MNAFRRVPPPNVGLTDDSPVDCRYELRYERTEPRARHEMWLLEWILEWTEDASLRTVNVDRDLQEYHVQIDIETGCQSDRPERHDRWFRYLASRVNGLSITCDPRPAAGDGTSSPPAATSRGVRSSRRRPFCGRRRPRW